jgi:aspartate/methionine/tyrosine aminotransferase
VAVLPGTAFGAAYDGHVRLSLATRRDHLLEAGRVLAAHLAPAERA